MKDYFNSRTTVVWAGLVGATMLSYSVGHGIGITDVRFAGMAILLVAFLKVTFIMLEFMEVRNAPAALKIAMAIWITIVCSALLTVYWLGEDPAITAVWPVIPGL